MRALLGLACAACFSATCFSITTFAQEPACNMRCAVLQQIFADEIIATIPLVCDVAAIRCQGAGALRVNGDMIPARIGSEFLATAIRLRIDTDQGVLRSGSGSQDDFDLSLVPDQPKQSKAFVVRWQPGSAPAPNASRHLGGHLRLVIDKYVAAGIH